MDAIISLHLAEYLSNSHLIKIFLATGIESREMLLSDAKIKESSGGKDD